MFFITGEIDSTITTTEATTPTPTDVTVSTIAMTDAMTTTTVATTVVTESTTDAMETTTDAMDTTTDAIDTTTDAMDTTTDAIDTTTDAIDTTTDAIDTTTDAIDTTTDAVDTTTVAITSTLQDSTIAADATNTTVSFIDSTKSTRILISTKAMNTTLPEGIAGIVCRQDVAEVAAPLYMRPSVLLFVVGWALVILLSCVVAVLVFSLHQANRKLNLRQPRCENSRWLLSQVLRSPLNICWITDIVWGCLG